jgi:hypothetical protein
MSVTDEQRHRMRSYYDGVARWMRPGLEGLAPDADEALGAARIRFDAMLDELPYVEQPGHTMAFSMYGCAALLAVWEVLRDAGVDVHAWGRAILTLPPVVGEPDEARREQERTESVHSQAGAAPDEFVWEIVDSDENGDRGMNITSCAICHLFGRHQAIELVPYMCAYDDVTSEVAGSGLRRTGTIALGADRCDFRFREGAEPRPLAPQFPDRIRPGGE